MTFGHSDGDNMYQAVAPLRARALFGAVSFYSCGTERRTELRTEENSKGHEMGAPAVRLREALPRERKRLPGKEASLRRTRARRGEATL